MDTEKDVEQLLDEVVVVGFGDFMGQIGLCDDYELKFKDELDDDELAELSSSGIEFIQQPDGDGNEMEAIPVGIVYFGTMLTAVDCTTVPVGHLRRANMSDLVSRSSVLTTQIMHHALNINGKRSYRQMASLFAELDLVTNAVWRMEVDAMNVSGDGKVVFLCHSSADKPFVRQVYNDLASQGFEPWLDEFEIKVGESIVEKIDNATSRADAVVLFLSKNSIEASWVKKEWQSVLMRRLSGEEICLLPARIDDVAPPAILADVKYANFHESYTDGLRSLLRAL